MVFPKPKVVETPQKKLILLPSALITGGAGFIGSALAQKLAEKKWPVIVYDNLSSGRRENVPAKAKLIVGDVLDEEKLEEVLRKSHPQVVVHLAAEPDVRKGEAEKEKIWRTNVEGTESGLMACENAGFQGIIVFASTSTVYGNAKKRPTPENAPKAPVSEYGKTKKEGEELVQDYCLKNGWRGLVVRFANVIGPKSGHGVIYDFFEKLKKNENELEVLGDGEQDKSYLYIDDAIRAVLTGLENGLGRQGETKVYNVGSRDGIKVKEIAEIVKRAAGVPQAESKFTGGNTGWAGDVPAMLLDCRKLEKLGWRAAFGSRQAVEKTCLQIAERRQSYQTG